MDRSEYQEKLTDPRWQKIRLKVFERDAWTCQSCSAQDRTLHVHHLLIRWCGLCVGAVQFLTEAFLHLAITHPNLDEKEDAVVGVLKLLSKVSPK